MYTDCLFCQPEASGGHGHDGGLKKGHAEAQGGRCVCQVWMFSIFPVVRNC